MHVAFVRSFQETVLTYYQEHGRHDLPWRLPAKDGSFDPYRILVSELMLQQTQVQRVIPKFQSFIAQFPSFEALAGATLADVLKAWSGLGYNRRAKYLWQAAQMVATEYQGKPTPDRQRLERLPGVGPNTAGAILAYAYNQPVVFIETNIRTVYIHHFFAGAEKVTDRELTDMVAQTLPDNPRQWYWALMDYGTFLKQTVGAQLHKVHGYKPQSKFEGSKRQIRGQVLRILGADRASPAALKRQLPDERLQDVLDDLEREGLIEKSKTYYRLTA